MTKKIETVTVLIAIVTMALLISSCNSNADTANGKSTVPDITDEASSDKSYTAADFAGTYLCRGQIYDQLIESSKEYIPYISFDGNGALTAGIYYIGGITYVSGTYSVENNTLDVKFDLTYSPVWSPDEKTQDRYMDDEFSFAVTDSEHIAIDKGYYVVNAGDVFEKADDEVRELPEGSRLQDCFGTYRCVSDKYENSSDAPYIYFAKEGHCLLHILSAEGYGRDIGGVYTYENGKFTVSLQFDPSYEKDADKDAIPHEYVFDTTDENSLKIDRGFYDVASGDLFVKE